jgi:hypothetical protein
MMLIQRMNVRIDAGKQDSSEVLGNETELLESVKLVE